MKTLCVKVKKQDGESMRMQLINLGVLDRGLKVSSDADFLYLPVSASISDFMGGESFVTVVYDIEPVHKCISVEDILGYSPKYEVIGSLALIDVGGDGGSGDDGDNDDLIQVDVQSVADALLTTQKHVTTVIGAVSAVEGEFRIRRFIHLAGVPTTQTRCRENGCDFLLDMASVYFTPRLATERARVVSQMGVDDVVVDMFAGVGPYSIQAAKKVQRVIAIDKNPAACEFLSENVKLNRVGNVTIINADARDVSGNYLQSADWIIMNLPHLAHEFLDDAVAMTKPGGIIIYYDMRHEDDLFDTPVTLIKDTAKRIGRSVEVVGTRVVRSYAPHEYNIVVDARIL